MLYDMTGSLTGAMMGGMGLIAQVTLPLPDDLKTWPVSAMLTLVALVSMSIMAYQIKANAESVTATAQSLTALAERTGETNRRLDEVAQKLGRTNDEMAATRIQLQNRPCILHDGQHR
jgi:hypothetical protein